MNRSIGPGIWEPRIRSIVSGLIRKWSCALKNIQVQALDRTQLGDMHFNVDSVQFFSNTLTGDIFFMEMRIMARSNFSENIVSSNHQRIYEAQNAILDVSVDRVFLMDKDFRMIWANRRSVIDLNIPIEDIVGNFCYEVFHGRDYHCDVCPAMMALKSGRIEYALIHLTESKSAEEDTYWEKYAAPIKNDSNQIINIFQISRNLTKVKTLEKELEGMENQIQSKRRELEELKAALKVLLKSRDEEKKELNQNLWFNVKDLVLPSLERLKKTSLDERQRICLEILEENLQELSTPFSRQMSFLPFALTPTEIQVTNLIKNGKSTKEIAQLLNLSIETIKSHRKSIRKKLSIRKKKINLRAFLISNINN